MSIRGKHGIAASVPAMPLIHAGTLIAFILASSGAYAGSAPPAIAAGGVPDPAVTGLAPLPTAGGTLKRGLAWVRSQPMFISGVVVSMGAPPVDFVREYFEDFHATAAHLWANGLPRELDGWRAAARLGRQDFRFVSWVEKDGASLDGGKTLGGYGPNPPGRIGYQVGDEPRSLQEYRLFEAGIAAVRAADPEALVIVNFHHGVRELPEMLARLCANPDGDVFSYDQYDLDTRVYRNLALFREWGQRCGKPYWRYLKSFYFKDKQDVARLTASDLRWTAYTGLVYGFTGHSWFLYQIPRRDDLQPAFFVEERGFARTKTDLWYDAAAINRTLKMLGRTLTRLVSLDVRYVQVGYGPGDHWQEALSGGDRQRPACPQGAPAWCPKNDPDPFLASLWTVGSEAPLLVGFFADGRGELYVMVQNLLHTHGENTEQGDETATVRLGFNFSQAPPGFDRNHVLSFNRLTGETVAQPLFQTRDGRRFLDMPLAAGDVFLFKYATGRPVTAGR